MAKGEAMTQGIYYSAFNAKQLEERLPFVMKEINSWDFKQGLTIKIEAYENPRTLSQNALFHVWCRAMSKHFIGKIPTATPDNMKLMMKKRFIGIEDIQIGKETIEGQVKSSSKLDKGEMVHFLDNVYHWARENKCLLEVPKDSEYQKMLDRQEA